MARHHDGRDDKPDNSERLDRELSSGFSNLWGACSLSAGGRVYALYLRQKSVGFWVAVAKRSATDNPAAEVAFGNGATIGLALADLNASISQGRWKRDVPWGERG